jgi:hypothetical protein
MYDSRHHIVPTKYPQSRQVQEQDQQQQEKKEV